MSHPARGPAAAGIDGKANGRESRHLGHRVALAVRRPTA